MKLLQECAWKQSCWQFAPVQVILMQVCFGDSEVPSQSIQRRWELVCHESSCVESGDCAAAFGKDRSSVTKTEPITDQNNEGLVGMSCCDIFKVKSKRRPPKELPTASIHSSFGNSRS